MIFVQVSLKKLKIFPECVSEWFQLLWFINRVGRNTENRVQHIFSIHERLMTPNFCSYKHFHRVHDLFMKILRYSVLVTSKSFFKVHDHSIAGISVTIMNSSWVVYHCSRASYSSWTIRNSPLKFMIKHECSWTHYYNSWTITNNSMKFMTKHEFSLAHHYNSWTIMNSSLKFLSHTWMFTGTSV